MNSQYKTLAAAAFALLLLAACGSSGGNIGDIFGGGSNKTATNEIRGTVDSVDLSSRSIYLTNVSGYNSMLSSGGTGSSVRVYYDNQTSVDYQGKTYRPEDLERGDQVDVRVQQSGNNLMATSMTVLSNVRTSGTYPGTSVSTIHGTVRSVNTSNRTITIDRGSGSHITVEYNTNTPVSYNGRSYMASDLEVGDEIDIRWQDLGSGRMLAQDITVTRSMSGGTSSTSPSTIRGTVRSVDAYNHTIQLDSPTFTGFNRNTTMNTITIQYDPALQIDVNGQLYPISGLERGDVIDVQVDSLGTASYFARKIFLVRDVTVR
ncbi:MAG TPA: DUF5666 domain-containing protein [Thermoanaerobaculia bacterium]|jgi:preprotein translocase subunit YajC|nr:DUF5666 domain-containing protein [Thermoanaerobaculia bacterium]